MKYPILISFLILGNLIYFNRSEITFDSWAKIKGDNFKLFWNYNPNSTITMKIQIKNTGYFAIGFGKDMMNADMIITQRIGDTLKVNDYYSAGFAEPKLDTTYEGGQENIHQIGYSITGL